MSDLLQRLGALWQQLMPQEAFISGWPGSHGMIFDPGADDREGLERAIDDLWRFTADLSHRSFLRWARTRIRMNNPSSGIEESITALGGCLMRSGPGSGSIGPLLQASSSRLRSDLGSIDREDIPGESRFMLLDRLGTLGRLLDSLPEGHHYQAERDSLISTIRDLTGNLQVEGLRGSSTVEVLELLDSGQASPPDPGDLDLLLSDLFSCKYNGDTIENELQMEIYRLMPELKRVISRSADELNVEKDLGEVSTSIAWERRVGGPIVEIAGELVQKLVPIVDGRVMDLPRTSRFRLMQAPSYLSPVVPDGFMFNYDGLTGDPSSILYLGWSDSRSDGASLPSLLMLLIRNYLGSRTLFQNSYRSIHREEILVDLLARPSARTMENGFIGLVEEIVLKNIVESIEEGSEDTAPLVLALIGYKQDYGPQELIDDLNFISVRDRMMSLLSGLCDVKVNSGRSSLSEFVRWANIITGIGTDQLLGPCIRSLVQPGSGSTSAMMLKGMRDIQLEWAGRGSNTREFLNTLSSVGYPELRRLRGCLENL